MLPYEAHVLQEILKINELMMRQAHMNEEFHGDEKLSPKNYKISKDENNGSVDRFDNDEAREIHFQATSRNISSPKGENISSSTTVFEIRSRTTLRNAESGRNKFSESVDSSEKNGTPSSDKNDQSLKVDELDILRSTMHENCANSSAKEENQVSTRRIRKMADRSIGDALFSYPFELVEIYSNKNKGKNSENDLNLTFDVSRQTRSMRTFPKEGDKQFKIEMNQLSASKEETCANNGKDGGAKDKVDEIRRKMYTKESDQSDDLQKERRKENCQNRNETVEEECALNNKDFHTKKHTQNNEDSQKKRKQENDEINEDFQKAQKFHKNNISETTVVKLIQDQENSIINSTIANDGTMQINKQRRQLDENFISTSKKAEAEQDVNLITIFQATGKPCTEETHEEENDLNKSEVTDETRKCNIKQSDDSSIFKDNIKLVKLQESCVRNDGLNVTEDTRRSLERTKDTSKEKEVVSTIEKQTSELKSANTLAILCSLKRVAKNHDLFVNEKSSKSLKFSDSVNNATIKIEDGASEETLRRDVESIPLSRTLCASNAEKSCVKIDNLNTSEHTDYSKFHKLTDKVEENVSPTFKEEGSQSVKVKRLRSTMNAGSPNKSNAFGSSSLRPKAEGNASFKLKGGNRNTETKCQKTNSNIDSRKSRVIDDNFFKQYSVNSNERKTSRTMMRHSESDDLKDSSSNVSSSLEDVHHQGKESNTEEKRNANEDLSKENKIKIIIEKRENKENKVISKDIISGDKNLLCNEDIQSSMIKNERTEERDSDDFYEEVTRVEINDAKRETVVRESRRIGINYKDLNVCKMLTKIHERLTSDWQRMEQLRMKLQISVSVELVNPMMMLQLLDKTIARCKSYIHGSNNSYETELEMAKLLSKYVVELVKIVKINRKSLEGQERRVEQMQSELVQGHHVNKKRTVLNEIIFTSNYWANEIFRLIKNISCLVKHIMAENEEKENIRNLGRCKTQRRIVNDAKQKIGTIRSKTTKSELAKKESTVETQMSVDSNALNTNSLKSSKSTKVLNSARYAEREKHSDDFTDKKTADNCHHSERVKPAKKIMLYTSSNQSKQTVSRQKHRAPSNQPVWRPGGAAKIPTFNSATTLNVQKTRPAAHNREKTNLENAREEKHGRTASEFKKKPSAETYSCKDAPKLNVDNSKIAGKRSDASLNISPRAKPRSRISRPLSKNSNESEKPFACAKNYARRSVCDMIHERVATESKERVLRALEEIVKTTSGNNEGENVGNVTQRSFRNQLPVVDLRRTSESIVVEEETKVNEEEPTRDIDSERYRNSQFNERSRRDPSEIILEKGEYSLASIVPKSLTPVLRAGVGKDTKNVGNFGHVPSDVEPNIALETSATNCRILDFNTISVETDGTEAWKSSDAVSDEKCKDEKFSENDISMEDSSFPDGNEKQQKYDDTESKASNNLSIVKTEKARVNSHAISLSMLKEFLYDQGIDVDLVNKAERYLKGKQKARKGLRKKSISFADVSSYVEHDRHFEKSTVLRKEHSCEEKLEKDVKKDDGKCIEKYIERSTEKDTEKNVEKSIEKDGGNDVKTDIERFKVLSEREISSSKMRDVTTCTIKNSNNACTQTVLHCRTSKDLQTISKNDSLRTTEETQTEVERRNACTMTESLRVNDDSVETESKICCSCKCVITERLDEFQSEESKFRKTRQDSGNSKSRGDPRDDSRNISTDIEGRKEISENQSENEDSKWKIRNDPEKGSESRNDFHEEVLTCSKKIDKTSSRECSLVYRKLFHQMQEEHQKSNALLTSVDSSTTHSSSSKSSKDHNVDENGTKEVPKDEDRSPVRIISSGIVAAFQVADIRARNVYRAFDIHKRILRSNLKKLRKQSRQRKKLDKVLGGTREQEHAKTVSESNAVLNFKKQVVRGNDDSKKTVVEVFKNLRRAEVASKEFLGEMLSDSRSESEDNLDFVDTSSTNTPSSRISFKSIDLEIPRRSSSSVILRNVTSLMEFLVNETDDATFERIERRVEKQSNKRETKFPGNVRMEIVKVNRRFSFFSKENLLLLVYGMLCSVVFWCLNFTITCDVVL